MGERIGGSHFCAGCSNGKLEHPERGCFFNELTGNIPLKPPETPSVIVERSTDPLGLLSVGFIPHIKRLPYCYPDYGRTMLRRRIKPNPLFTYPPEVTK